MTCTHFCKLESADTGFDTCNLLFFLAQQGVIDPTLLSKTLRLLTFSSPSGIEDLHSKREELNRQIRQEEEEKERLAHDIRVLSEKLSRVNESLAQRLAARATFDRTIAETEAAYTKACVFNTFNFTWKLFGSMEQDVSACCR